ncbi:hypothetical protein CYMTET_23800, partial [Cymbomonas tetramitiformis]
QPQLCASLSAAVSTHRASQPQLCASLSAAVSTHRASQPQLCASLSAAVSTHRASQPQLGAKKCCWSGILNPSRLLDDPCRLARMAATAVLIMESFHGLSHKYDYCIVGHNGDSERVPIVDFGKPPATNDARFAVIKQLYGATFCRRGDNTLAAAAAAVAEVTKEPADDYFVVVLSDANLSEYGVDGESMTEALMSNPKVNAHAVFIADEASGRLLKRGMPAGRAHVVLDTAKMPTLFKNLFQHSFLRSKL